MMSLDETEKLIKLLYMGFDLELISFELDVPIEQLYECEKRLNLRQFTKDSIKNNNIAEAIDKLNVFINSTDNNIIERTMLLKLQAYTDKTTVNEEDLKHLDEEAKKLGLPNSIDNVLANLKLQIPRRKNSNMRKKSKQTINEQAIEEEQPEEPVKPDYEKMISKYKSEIAFNPQNSQRKRNLLAFSYFRSGQIDEARNELISLLGETTDYMAYRQLVHIEKKEENFEDAKLWAYEALDKFPDSIDIRKQLISIAKAENDRQEIITQLKDILSIEPGSEKNKMRLQAFLNAEER
ncbi:MAG: tetratricopeptide repeat protein [Clostridia bacterium]